MWKLINKVWIKFESDDIACICSEDNRKCSEKCEEYIMKLVKIDRAAPGTTDKVVRDFGKSVKDFEKGIHGLEKELKGVSNELRKSINRFKI